MYAHTLDSKNRKLTVTQVLTTNENRVKLLKTAISSSVLCNWSTGWPQKLSPFLVRLNFRKY